MKETKAVLVSTKAGVTEILLNRPDYLNAVNGDMVDDLDAALDNAEQDPTCRVVIITGSGRAFCAGSDVAALRRMNSGNGLEHISKLVAVIEKIEKMRVPVLAAINGPCMGGGLEIALACTMRVASESALLGLPEVRIGVIPGAGGIERLRREIGFGRAAKVILTGKVFTARQALELDIVQEIVPYGQAVNAAKDLAKNMLRAAPGALEAAKHCLYSTRDMEMESGISYSMNKFCELLDTDDKAEGIDAFLEKRDPAFRGS